MTIPSWVDPETISRGQTVFWKNAPACGMALMYLSLVGGFGAPRINKVLISTGYLGNNQTAKRLLETSQMIFDCMLPDSLRPGLGVGWRSCLKVRFLHARVRQRLRNSEKWNQEAWGVPINQEDLIATQTSFSFNIILALGIMGVRLSEQEAEDFLHLWRYIGYLSGVKEELNPLTDFTSTRTISESLILHLIDPDESSVFLAHHNIESLMDSRFLFRHSLAGHYQLARMLMGDGMADKLKLPSSAFEHAKNYVLFFLLFRYMSFTASLPIIGPMQVEVNKSFMLHVITQGLKGTADFEMTRWSPPLTILSSPFNPLPPFRPSASLLDVPSSESIDNLDALRLQKGTARLTSLQRKIPAAPLILLLLALVLIFQKLARNGIGRLLASRRRQLA